MVADQKLYTDGYVSNRQDNKTLPPINRTLSGAQHPARSLSCTTSAGFRAMHLATDLWFLK